MRQTRLVKKTRKPREIREVLSLDPRDPDVQRAKRLMLELRSETTNHAA
jgi:hypothetical protein